MILARPAARPYRVGFAAVAALSLAILGCNTTSLAPDDPEPLLFAEYQNGDLVLGRLVYLPCPSPQGTWLTDSLPPGDPLTLDLYYPNQSTPDPFPGLLPENVTEVENSGADVLMTFNMGVIRASAYRSQLSAVSPHVARAVPDPTRFDVRVSVGYTEHEAMEFFVGLGGAIERQNTSIRNFSGVVPDGRIPELRAHPSVRYVQHEIFYCP